MKSLFFSVATLAVFFTACSKDDNKTVKKYLQVKVSEIDSLQLTYNEANQISYSYLSTTGTDPLYTKPVYENGKLASLMQGKSEITLSETQSYVYRADGKLRRVNFHSPDGEIANYDSLFYDAGGRITGYLVLISYGNQIYSKNNFVWDNNGNIISESQIAFSDGKETKDSTIIKYTYDSKVNYAARQSEFFMFDPSDAALGLSANNVLTFINTHNTEVTTVTNEYTYDEEGYPVTQKKHGSVMFDGTELGSSSINYSLRYFKK